jgi:predicted DsbA family dithiol-disulfide isomerase
LVFPLPSHFNAERAARAVEAAAQQGKLEPMYQKMYETEAQWGEQREPADTVFRGFAQDLGLDMLAFDATYHSPETLHRVPSTSKTARHSECEEHQRSTSTTHRSQRAG